MKTKALLATLAVVFLPAAVFAETETVNGITWTYTVSNGKVSIESVPRSTTGAIVIPSTLSGSPVTGIGNNAFGDCHLLTSVTIPESVTSIGYWAFRDCSRLTNITIPARVTSIGSAAFYGCSGLLSISVADGNASYQSANGLLLSKDGKILIAGINGNVTIPDSVTSIGDNAFIQYGGLTSVTIPDSVTSIGDYAFSGCIRLPSITIPESVTSIGYGAFWSCSCLTSLTIPDSVTSIGSNAFSDCSGLTSVTIPDGVTSIGGGAFSGCFRLPSITIPESVTSIGSGAFEGVESVFILGEPVLVQNEWENPYDGIGLVYYPRQYAQQYRKFFSLSQFGGFVESANRSSVQIVSSSIRENDPTIMDVVYKVTSAKPTVKVRALAFEDGERSFAKVVRPETFVEGTATNIGDSIAANVEHTLSWQVSSDWTTRLAKLKFEVLACEGELLSMEWMTIPATEGSYGTMKASWNAHTTSQVFDALLWLYADKDTRLLLSNGVLRNGGRQLASGTEVSYYNAIRYVFSRMGYSPLSDDTLAYVNDETRLGLSLDEVWQYAYKIVEDDE